MNLWRYKIPYTKPLVLKGKEYTHREGLIVKIKSLGEIAPLPGFSSESLAEAQVEATQVLQSQKKPTLPSVQFGITTALRAPSSIPSMPIYGLVWGEDKPLDEKKEYKVKVSSFSVVEAVDRITTLKKRYPSIKLRIDSNQKWSLEEALYFVSHFKKEDFAYLEEPVKSFDELVQFSKKTSFPIAADESLLTEPIENILSLPSLEAVIIKPTIYNLTTKVPCRVIYSSSIESSIGLAAIQALAHLNGSKEALGIDTVHLLNEKEAEVWEVFPAL